MTLLPSLLGASSPALPARTTTTGSGSKDARLAELRRAVARLERGPIAAPPTHLSLGLPEVHRHLAGPGLALGALHEILAAAHGDRPAAFGFAAALGARAHRARRGAFLLVAPRRCFAEFGMPYGHGLRSLGLDLGRVLLVETRNDQDALWAMEEALRPETGVAAIAGMIGGKLGLTESRRLNLAAAASGALLTLLRPHDAAGTTAAATRWRLAAAMSGRDRFGALSGPRWNVALERCRNGRTGHWLLEWDHVADRFRLAQVMADRAPAARPGQSAVQATSQATGRRSLRLAG